MKFTRMACTALLLCSVFVPMNGQVKTATRMDRSKLNIGTYYLDSYAHSEQHVKDLKECGIDFVIGMDNDSAVLDLFQKYGVGAIVGGIFPGWWGGNGEKAGSMNVVNPISKYDEGAAKFKDHPAIWGLDIGDEPSALDFPYYGKVFSHVKERFPHLTPYLNLYPNYASVSENSASQTESQLGTASYEEHIASYCKNLKAADYLSYDFYLYHITVNKAYENLRVVANACLGSDRSMWIILQVNSWDPKAWISENELRFQAYTAMAFGAENITWACYTAGWWHNQVLDKKGHKTQQYDKLKRVNAEIHAMADAYMKYRRVQTDFVGFAGTKWLEGVKQSGVEALNNGTFCDARMTDGTPMVVGSMVSRAGDDANAIFVCSADDPYDKNPQNHILRFRADGRKVTVTSGTGSEALKPDAQGYYQYTVVSNAGVLIEAR